MLILVQIGSVDSIFLPCSSTQTCVRLHLLLHNICSDCRHSVLVGELKLEEDVRCSALLLESNLSPFVLKKNHLQATYLVSVHVFRCSFFAGLEKLDSEVAFGLPREAFSSSTPEKSEQFSLLHHPVLLAIRHQIYDGV
jgi:hypothetical protein